MSGPFDGRISVTVGSGAAAQSFTGVTAFSLSRDLRDVSARFHLELYDAARALAAFPGAQAPGFPPTPFVQGAACSIAIDGTPVLVGWVDIAEGELTGTGMRASLQGRDATGDLVDCAACPNGPAEFKGVGLLAVATQVCAPFGIKVTAQTDLGAPFERLAVGPAETAMVVLEKAARQRAVLVVSDGVGGLLLTTGGREQAPGELVLGEAIQAARYHFDWTRRYSDVFVKGQTERANGHRVGVAAPLNQLTAPVANPNLPAGAQGTEATAILMTGHAQDPEVTRWRPRVEMTRTQSGMSSTQVQADWRVRVFRGESTLLRYTVLDWRVGGPGGALWLPNQAVRVYDPYAGVDEVLLIRRVHYQFGPAGENGIEGARTDIEVVGLHAFDQVNRPASRTPLRPKQAPYPNQYTQFPLRPQ